MKKLSILLLVCIIGALCLSSVKCEEATPTEGETAENLQQTLDDAEQAMADHDKSIEGLEGEDDTDLPDMDDEDFDNVSAVDEEWKKVLAEKFGDDNVTHQFQTILDLAYQHLIYEEMDELTTLMNKHDKKEKLNDEEAATLSNAMVVKSYVEEKFGGKSEVSNAEALEILNHDNYDSWMDNMPDDIIQKIDQFMPDEESNKTDL